MAHSKSKLSYLIFSCFLIVILGIGLALQGSLFSAGRVGAIYKVVRRSQGFQPDTISIQKGDSVTFLNETNVPFWPASNLHPTHLIYPEFDPKEPIAPGKAWTFSFDRAGIWRYHDHLAPSLTGSIEVHE